VEASVINNPWTRIPTSAPFVLPEDAPFVRAFNGICDQDGDKQHLLNLNFPPSPFVGFHDAPLVVLLANPLLVADSLPEKLEPRFLENAFRGITSEGGTAFWPVLDEWKETQSAQWWRPRTADLMDALGSYEALSRKLLSIDLHGYNSLHWSTPYANFPSQAFSFYLVQEAINREATIVIARCWREWYAAVPELGAYKKKIAHLDSPRSSFLSRANMDGSSGCWALIEEALGAPK
jgi:hypothetical protein